jgi:hypothetical protein
MNLKKLILNHSNKSKSQEVEQLLNNSLISPNKKLNSQSLSSQNAQAQLKPKIVWH